MSDFSSYSAEEARKHQRPTERSRSPEHIGGDEPPLDSISLNAGRLLANRAAGASANIAMRTAAIQNLQRTHGNRAVQRFIQRSTSAPGTAEDDQLARRIEAVSGSGSRLDHDIRGRLEEGLGADLSGVRIHVGGDADNLARSMGAVAFTTGQDIFFREGTFNPHSDEGLKLLAHEVTHTVQQAAGPVEGTEMGGGVSVSDPQDSFEQEAERAVEAVVSGGTADLAARGTSESGSGGGEGAPVQRFLDEAMNALGIASDPINLVTSGIQTAGEYASLGRFMQGVGGYTGVGSSVVNYLGKSEALANMAPGFQGMSTAGKVSNAAGNAANVLGAGLGLYKMATADSGFDVLEGGADTAASLIGFAGPLGRAFSAGYSGGRLLDQGAGYLGDKLSRTETGEALGMNPGGDYSLSSLIGKGGFALDKKISSLLPGYDDSLEYNPETDDPSKVDRSYENTLSWKINQVLDGETNYTGEAADYVGKKYDQAKESVSETYNDVSESVGETYNDVKETAGEVYDDAGEAVNDTVEYVKNIDYNPMNWF